jgi:hypothetical protein
MTRVGEHLQLRVRYQLRKAPGKNGNCSGGVIIGSFLEVDVWPSSMPLGSTCCLMDLGVLTAS